jgi:hypothetical protein
MERPVNVFERQLAQQRTKTRPARRRFEMLLVRPHHMPEIRHWPGDVSNTRLAWRRIERAAGPATYRTKYVTGPATYLTRS